MPSHIIAMAIEAGQDGPLGERPAYQPEPGIPPHLLFYWDAFWDLASTDGIGFAELDRYAARYGVEGVDEFDRFKTIVRRVNTVWAEIVTGANKPPAAEDGDEQPRPSRARAKVI
jgi:hypothetical protein